MIKENNYITIQGFMVTNLHLKGNELLVYALIYGFSQDGESEFTGALSYLKDWFDISRPTAIKVLKSLQEKGLIQKTEIEVAKNITRCTYKAVLDSCKETLQPVNNFNRGGKETLQGVLKNFTGGCKETLHNNKPNKSSHKNNHINAKSKHYEKFGFEGHDYDWKKLEEQLTENYS